MSTSLDYIIVGQGLAGSAMAAQLLMRGKKIGVIDQPSPHSASRVAAGLFNPVTGRKMSRTWMADTLFPHLEDFYRTIEARTAERFFYPMPLYRPFLSAEEQNEWMGLSADEQYRSCIDHVVTQPSYADVHDPFGGLMLKQCGYVDTVKYLLAMRRWISAEGVYIESTFDESQLEIGTTDVTYGDWRASRIIFCQGVAPSRWFGWVPVRPLKGETIRVRTQLDPSVIFNRGVYVVPTGDLGEYTVGATYFAKDHVMDTTPEARRELEEKLNELVTVEYAVTGQHWGMRPTTPDRRPLLGTHPEHSSLCIFNGLGTKGVSLSPYFSEVLIRSLENNVALNNAVNVNRYNVLYWSDPK